MKSHVDPTMRAAGRVLAALLVLAAAGACGQTASPSGTPPTELASPAASLTATPTATPTETPTPTPTPIPTPNPSGPIGKLVFGPAGAMTTGRFQPTVTALADGRVLVAAGSASEYLASTEIWDPASGDFAETGSLAQTRVGATATLLADGRVLVAGGNSIVYDSAGKPSLAVLASAELYDPATGTFSATGSMVTGRNLATATRLADGRVLIAGGYTSKSCLASAELFDPATGTFSVTGSMSKCRYEHSAALLHDGRVIVAGGYTKTGPLSSVELYDPATGKFRAAAGLAWQGAYPSVVVLANGKVLIGGGTLNARPELFDPVRRTSSGTGRFVHARYGQTAVLLPNGRVLIAGGTNPKPQRNGQNAVLASLETYDPATGKFADAGVMDAARTDAFALVLPGGVLIVGGYGGATGDPLLPSAELAPFATP